MIKGELQGHKIVAKDMEDFRRQIAEIEKKIFAAPEDEETDMTEDQWVKNCKERIEEDIRTSNEAIKLMHNGKTIEQSVKEMAQDADNLAEKEYEWGKNEDEPFDKQLEDFKNFKVKKEDFEAIIEDAKKF